MKILIIEDEVRAARRLEKILLEIDPEIEIMDKIESVRESLSFFENGNKPHLILSDIQLEDGLSFEIFELIEVPCPIIFTTAYDQYAIHAFQTNGIDYLLKPVESERLQQSLQKARKLTQHASLEHLLVLANSSIGRKEKFKSRFVIKLGERLKSIGVEEALAFLSMDNGTYIFCKDGRKYPIDFSLDQIDGLVNPEQFFRISRKYIISIHGCDDIVAWSNSRLKIQLNGLNDHMMVVARERVQGFREWLDR